MALDIVSLLAGLVLLFFGGEWLVRGAVSLANRLGLPPLLIGLTVIGFGTSMPELLVSLRAAMNGSPDIAVGNVVGSNIANVLLIAGRPRSSRRSPPRSAGSTRDLAMMICASSSMLALGALGGVPACGRRGDGCWGSPYTLPASPSSTARTTSRTKPRPGSGFPAGWKRSCLPAASPRCSSGRTCWSIPPPNIARAAGLSEAVIGLSVVAVGTSLPELATSVAAAMRRHGEVALGNVVGSNMFNILAILGITSIVEPIDIAPSIAQCRHSGDDRRRARFSP